MSVGEVHIVFTLVDRFTAGLIEARVSFWAFILRRNTAKLMRTYAVTDDLDPTPEEIELQKAKEAAAVPAEPVDGAEDLPDDVKDGEVVDADTVTITGDNLVVTEDDGEP